MVHRTTASPLVHTMMGLRTMDRATAFVVSSLATALVMGNLATVLAEASLMLNFMRLFHVIHLLLGFAASSHLMTMLHDESP
jgi:hypothetical protein